MSDLATALIPAAGRGLKPYPAWDTVDRLMHPVLDRDGLAKPVLQILAEDALAAGVGRIVLVVGPDEEIAYRRQLSLLATTLANSPASLAPQKAQAAWLADLLPRLAFAVQDQPRGLGHALWCARDLVPTARILVMLSDHLPLSHAADRRHCAAQLADAAKSLDGPVSVVEPLPEHLIRRYGVIAGVPVPGRGDLWSVTAVVEKPSPTRAECDLETPGLRRGEYLGFTGMHLLPSSILARIGARLDAGGAGAGDLSPVLDELARSGPYHALRINGMHQDIGSTHGLLEAQLGRVLLGPDRERMLGRLVDLLARDVLARNGQA